MSPLIFSAVLFAAVLHATWNALIKVSGDRLVVMAVTTAFTSMLVFPLLFILPFPAQPSWIFLALSALVHTFYLLLLVKAYGYGDFAQVYPLARGSAPLLTSILGFLFLSEAMDASEIFGMLLIVSGIFALAFQRRDGKLQLSRPALFYSLMTGVFISAYSLVYGVGARLSGNSLIFTAWLFFFDGFALPVTAYFRRPKELLRSNIKEVWKSGILVALLSLVGYAIIVWAFSLERIAPVSILRETSVMFALLISIFILKEGFSKLRTLIVFLILSGIVLMGI